MLNAWAERIGGLYCKYYDEQDFFSARFCFGVRTYKL